MLSRIRADASLHLITKFLVLKKIIKTVLMFL